MSKDQENQNLNPVKKAPPGTDQTKEGWPHPSTYPPHMMRWIDAIQEEHRKYLA